MAKCSQCRRASDLLDSRWDKIRLWLFNHLFAADITDLSQDKFTQGFSDGYKAGFARGEEMYEKTNSYRYKVGDLVFPQVGDPEINLFAGLDGISIYEETNPEPAFKASSESNNII